MSFSSVDWLLWTDGSVVQLGCWVLRVHEAFFFFPSFPPSSSLVSCMKLASCPGQGLCLSHARLDPRHFIALTLPPTVTAALNEAAHMCSDQVGPEPGVQLDVVGWTSLTLAHGCARAPYGFAHVCFVLLSRRGVRALTLYQAGTMACPR